MTMSAAVRFRPVPPAFKEMQNTGTSFVVKLSTNCIDAGTTMENNLAFV